MSRFLFAPLLTLLAALTLASPAQARLFTQPELDALVAPIALYPDGLISDVLVAATHPDQVAAAARLPKGAQPDESWDPAVKSLLSFPDILNRMAESPQWTRDLGEAFAGQEPHVLDTVQSLRRRAQAQGTLKSSDQVTVRQEGPAIVVQPRTEVVYLPYYDPYVVYGPWWWPAYTPVYWRPWVVAPVVVTAGFFFAWTDWHARRVVTVNNVVVNRTRFVNAPQRTNFERRTEPRDFHRMLESQQRPAARGAQRSRGDERPQHAMPAAPRFSEQRQQAVPSRQGDRRDDHRETGRRDFGRAAGNAPNAGRAHQGNSGRTGSPSARAHPRG